MKTNFFLVLMFFVYWNPAFASDPELSLRQQIEQDPFNAAARVQLIEFYRKQKNFDQAQKEIGLVDKIAPGDLAVAAQKAHLAFDQKQYTQAVSLYSALEKAKYSLDLVLLRRAQAYIALGRPYQAIADITRIRAMMPENTKLAMFQAETMLKFSDKKGAREIFKQVMQAKPEDSEPVVALAELEKSARTRNPRKKSSASIWKSIPTSAGLPNLSWSTGESPEMFLRLELI